MSRSSLLPDELVARLRGTPKEELRQQMHRSIARRAVDASLSIDTETLDASIEALDERYFTLREAGRETESMEYFRQARMLAALRYLHTGEDEQALYEFSHSLGKITAADTIAELERA